MRTPVIFAAALCAAVATGGADFNVRDFGARGDGVANDAAAIQRALDACAKEGGGRVLLPQGTYLSGTVWLGDGTDFHLEKGAVLLGSPDLRDYNGKDAYPQNFGSKREGWSAAHLVIALERRNVSISGEGSIDGNARAFMQDIPLWYGYDGWLDGMLNARDQDAQSRPGPEVVFVECENVSVEGVTLRDMACWSCLFHGCDGVRISGVTVRNDRRYANTDGFDIDSCRNVVATGCDIETGDDCFALRGSPERLKNKSRICENVVISNNTCSSSANGIRIGVGRSAVRNVRIGDLRVNRAANGIRLQSAYRGKGALSISNVTVERAVLSNVLRGVVIESEADSPGAVLSDVRFSGLSISAPRPVEVRGSKLARPARVSFADIRVAGAEYPFLVRDADGVSYSGVDFGWGRFARVPPEPPETSGAYVSSDTSRPPYDPALYPDATPVVAPEGDFGALRQWLDRTGRADDEEAMCHFMERYYGTAWRVIRHYVRELYAQEVNRFKDVARIGSRDPYEAPRMPDGFRPRAAFLWKRAIDIAEIIDKAEPAYASHVRQSMPPGLLH